jgi:hypothetical protein
MAQIRAGRRETRHTHEVSRVRQCHEFAQEHGGGQMRRREEERKKQGRICPVCMARLPSSYCSEVVVASLTEP